jgi:hypothetical protein
MHKLTIPHRLWTLRGAAPFVARPVRDNYLTRHKFQYWYIENSAGYNALSYGDGAVFCDKQEALHIEQEAANYA